MARDSDAENRRADELERELAEEREIRQRHCRAVSALEMRCHSESLSVLKERLDRQRMLWESGLGLIERTLGRFATTVGNVFAEGIVEGSVQVDRAMKSLAKAIIADLVTSMIRLTYQQAIFQARQKLTIAQNAVEAASVWGLVAAYRALAVAKMAAFGPVGILLPFHTGGAVMHSGGTVGRLAQLAPKRAHMGLRSDEAGPFILQRGEYVVRRDAARRIGYDVMEHINRTGRLPQASQPAQVNINMSVSALDAKGFEDVTMRKIIPAIRRATERGIKAVHRRGVID